MSSFEDGDYSEARFVEAYNAGLANGIGNLTSRIMKLASTYLDQPINPMGLEIPSEFKDYLENFDIKRAFDHAWGAVSYSVSDLDNLIQKEQAFKTVKNDLQKGKSEIAGYVSL